MVVSGGDCNVHQGLSSSAMLSWTFRCNAPITEIVYSHFVRKLKPGILQIMCVKCCVYLMIGLEKMNSLLLNSKCNFSCNYHVQLQKKALFC